MSPTENDPGLLKPDLDAKFTLGQMVFCYYGQVLYEAKIIKIKVDESDGTSYYYVHYHGWKAKYDQWVLESRYVL